MGMIVYAYSAALYLVLNVIFPVYISFCSHMRPNANLAPPGLYVGES